MATGVELSRDRRTAVEKALDVLLAFGDRGHSGLGVSELARRATLSKSTTFRLLAMLEGRGAVERAGTRYRLGAQLHELGTHVYAPDHREVRDLLTPFLAELFVLTHETVHLAVLHGTDVLYLNKLAGYRTVSSPSRIGGRAPAFCTAVGKALLAFDPVASEAALDDHRADWTPFSLVAADRLVRELLTVRRDGIAFANQEARMGLSCVSVPVLGSAGRPVAALSVSGATGRFNSQMHAAALRRVGHEATIAVTRHTGRPRKALLERSLAAVGA